MSTTPKQWMEEVEYYLMSNQGVTYALFMHQMEMRPLYTPAGGFAPAAIGVRTDGTIYIHLWYPFVSKLSLRASAELLKHEVLHFVFGHVSSRYTEICKAYGRHLVNIAADLVVNQYVDEPLLESEGCPGVTVEKLKLPPNLTTMEYCEILKNNPQLVPPEPKFWEVFSDDGEEVPDAVKDTAMEQAISIVMNEAMKRDPAASKTRGWTAGEAKEFIEQLKRKAQVPWHRRLRALEGGRTMSDRVPSLVRPSRRHPAHFGRVKRNELTVWFAIDTSGSMGTQELRLVDAELRGIHERGGSITVLHCDAGIAKEETYQPNRLKEFYGRGGTDFTPVFEKVVHAPRMTRPSFVVYYTDGFGCASAFEQAQIKLRGEEAWDADIVAKPNLIPGTNIPLLWLLTEHTMKPEMFRKQVPFGEIAVIELPKGQKNEVLDEVETEA